MEKLEARDRDVLDASLDYGDHDNMPWRAEVGLALGLLVLFIVVPLLVLLFSGLKALAGG